MASADYNNLKNLGYSGSLGDMRKEYLKDQGYDTLYDYLKAQGYTGALPDMLFQQAASSGLGVNEFNRLVGNTSKKVRHFMNFTGVQYGVVSRPVTLISDFDLTVKAECRGAPQGIVTFCTDNPSEYFRLASYDDNGKTVLKLGTSGFTTGNGSTELIAGQIYEFKLVREGNVFSLYVNGSFEYSVEHGNPQVLDKTYTVIVGMNANNDSAITPEKLIGTIENIKLEQNGEPVPGLGDIRIDDPNSIYQRDYSADQSGGFVGIELKDTIIPGDFEQYERRAGWDYWQSVDDPATQLVYADGADS